MVTIKITNFGAKMMDFSILEILDRVWKDIHDGEEIFYKFFIMIKRIKPNLKFIIAGDFNQLPPVKDRIGESFNYIQSQALLELCFYSPAKKLSKILRWRNPSI